MPGINVPMWDSVISAWTNSIPRQTSAFVERRFGAVSLHFRLKLSRSPASAADLSARGVTEGRLIPASRPWESKRGPPRPLTVGRGTKVAPSERGQLAEAGVAPQRRPLGVDAQQGWRQIAGNGEELLDELQGRIRIAHLGADGG